MPGQRPGAPQGVTSGPGSASSSPPSTRGAGSAGTVGATTGVGINLRRLLSDPDVAAGHMHTGLIAEKAELAAARSEGIDIWVPPGIDLKQDLDDVAALTCAISRFARARFTPWREATARKSSS